VLDADLKDVDKCSKKCSEWSGLIDSSLVLVRTCQLMCLIISYFGPPCGMCWKNDSADSMG